MEYPLGLVACNQRTMKNQLWL